MTARAQSKPLLTRWYGYVLYNVPIFFYTIVLAIAAMFAFPFDHSGRLQHKLAWLWSWLILRTIGCRITVRGMERVDTGKPCVWACNHASALDIPVAYTTIPTQFRIMAKRELFNNALIGPWLRHSGQIPIERESAMASLRSLNHGVTTLKAGMPLFVFPEGGRSEDGQIKPFLSGAFYVAIKAKMDVVPMALTGMHEMLPMGSMTVSPRPVEVIVGEPIPTASLTLRDMDALAARVQQVVAELYAAGADRSTVNRDAAETSPVK